MPETTGGHMSRRKKTADEQTEDAWLKRWGPWFGCTVRICQQGEEPRSIFDKSWCARVYGGSKSHFAKREVN
jgi:hypothetical protein